MPKSRIQRRVNPAAAPVEVKLDTLTQGVSQQPPHIRAVGQGTEQINAWSSPVEGLTKRNPMRLLARLLSNPSDDFYLEIVTISKGERYQLFIFKGDSPTLRLEIWKNNVPLDDTKCNVHGEGMTYAVYNSVPGWNIGSTAYLANPEAVTAKELYKAYVLTNNGSLGLLANRNKVTAYKEDTGQAANRGGLVFIQSIAYSVTYTLTDDGVVLATHTTPRADDADNTLSTTAVAQDLYDQIDDSIYDKEIEKYVIYLKKKSESAAPMKLVLDDGRSNALARAFTTSVALTSYLPLIAKAGYIVKVENDPSSEVDDLWLKFSVFEAGESMGEGNWAECAAPGIDDEFDVDTMPYVFYRKEDGIIFFGPADGSNQTVGTSPNEKTYTFPQWRARTAGNRETNPDPAFLGNAIRDHQIFRQRYTVLAGESVQFSEVDDAFNFFLDTSRQITPTDTFSLRCQSEVSSPLEWMLSIDDSILTFSSTSQFQLRAADGDVLTPLTGLVIRLSNIDMNANVRPKKAGAQVLFPSVEYGFTHFREYQFFNASSRRLGLNLGGSNDTMLNLPKYLPGLVTHFDVGEGVDFAVASSPSDRSILYVYKYLWSSGESGIQKVQASWSKWKLTSNVRWFKFIDNILYVLVDDGTAVYLCVYYADEIETEDSIQPHLDRLLLYPECNEDALSTNDVIATYDEAKDRTTFTLPYDPQTDITIGVRYLGQENCGLILAREQTKVIECKEPGDWTDKKIFLGEDYEFSYTFTKAFIPEPDQARRRTVGNLEGRTQVLTWQVNHYNTGFYKVRISRQNRENDTVHTFRARDLGVSNNVLTNTRFLDDGSFRVPVYCRNLETEVTVESTNHLPIVLTSAAWSGTYNNRARGLN